MTRRRRRKKPPTAADDAADEIEISIEDEASEAPGPDAGAGPEGPEKASPEAGAPSDETPGAESPDPEAPDAKAEDPEARVQELEDRVKRLQAEFLNETKRIARQAEDSRKFAVFSLVTDLVPLFDALHSARSGLDAPGTAKTADAVREGLDLVERELLNALGRHGVERIEAAESPFDPTLHEALFVVDDPDLPPNTVAQVLRPGFTLHGRVVRAAHVAVTRAPASDASDASDADAADADGEPSGASE